MRFPRPKRKIINVIAALLAGGFFVAPLGAQSGSLGRAKMDDLPRPFTKFSNSAESLRDSIVSMAKRQVGVRYRTGASSPEKGFDCSGLAKYVMSYFNIALPRTSREQAKVGKALAREVSALRPGDLLTFGKGKRVSHVGIYIGDGKYVHANSPGGKVKESSLLTGRIAGWWKGARRVVVLTDSSTGSPAN